MKLDHLKSIEQLKAFLNGSQAIAYIFFATDINSTIPRRDAKS